MAEIQKNKVVIHLMGRDYALLTQEDPAQVQRVARYVDRKMRELSAAGLTSREVVSVLAALQLADELLISQSENTRLRRKLDEMSHD